MIILWDILWCIIMIIVSFVSVLSFFSFVLEDETLQLWSLCLQGTIIIIRIIIMILKLVVIIIIGILILAIIIIIIIKGETLLLVWLRLQGTLEWDKLSASKRVNRWWSAPSSSSSTSSSSPSSSPSPLSCWSSSSKERNTALSQIEMNKKLLAVEQADCDKYLISLTCNYLIFVS